MFSNLRKKVDEALPRTNEEASKGTQGYPADFSVGALRERRLLMSLRAITFAMFLSLIINGVLIFLLVGLFPLKEIRPFLVRVSDAGDVVSSIMPIQDTFEAKNVLTEKLVREYVTNRHEILRSDLVMQDRWAQTGYMGLTSTKDEYQRFVTEVTPNLDIIRSQGAERRVSIKGVATVQVGKVYIVDFESISYDQRNREILKKNYAATVEIDFRPLRDLTREQMIVNPTGFTVNYFSLAEKEE